MVLFDQATYDKLLSEAPKYKLITPSILSDRLRVLFIFTSFYVDHLFLLLFPFCVYIVLLDDVCLAFTFVILLDFSLMYVVSCLGGGDLSFLLGYMSCCRALLVVLGNKIITEKSARAF